MFGGGGFGVEATAHLALRQVINTPSPCASVTMLHVQPIGQPPPVGVVPSLASPKPTNNANANEFGDWHSATNAGE